MNESLFQLGGRLHPLLLHIPIGVIGALLLLEVWGLLRRRALERGVRLPLIWFLAVAAGISVASGIQLSLEQTYIGDTVELHRWLGIATASLILIMAVLATLKCRRGYVAALILAAGVIIPTAHFGATMTHGPDFLTAPFAKAAHQHESNLDSDPTLSWYESQIAPILEAHCTVCHGETRRKSGLSLHTQEAIAAGGESGSILQPRGAGPGPMLRRIQLPLGDDDHMPPENKPQLSPSHIETLKEWIEAGASFDAPRRESPEHATATETPEPEQTVAGRVIPPGAIADLQAAHVHVEVIDPEARLLWIDFGAMPDIPAQEAVRLLRPLAPFTSELSLRGMKSANQVLALCGPWEQLRQLDLSYADVGRDGLAAAIAAGQLTELTLIATNVTPEAAEHLLTLETLEQLHIWDSNVPENIIAQLREQRPELTLNEGTVAATPPLETEPEFKPGAPVIVSLTPVNMTCPVSGRPIDPKYAVVHEGRVIAFCCENCPGQFWADPGQFTVEVAKPDSK